MSDASDSGEKTKVERMIEKTHISVRSAIAVIVIMVVPLTIYLIKLSSTQTATDTKIETNSEKLNAKLDANAAAAASKMDSLIAVMQERKLRRDEQVTTMEKKLEDHEVRIRIIEKNR